MNLVVGGTGPCVFYLASTEVFITNWNFEVNLTDWTGKPAAGNIARIEDVLTFWGEYSMKVDASSDLNAYALTTVETSAELWGRSFILEFAIRTDVDRDIKILIKDVDDYQTFNQTFTAESGKFTHYFYYFVFLPLGSPVIGPTEIEVRLYGTDTMLGLSYFDNVNLYEVTEKINLRVPEVFESVFGKELEARFELLSGRTQEYLRGWRFQASMAYEYLTKVEEEKRTRISDSDLMVFQPHDDNEFMVVSRWNGDFARTYFGDIYVGHTGSINLIGAHLLNKSPV